MKAGKERFDLQAAEKSMTSAEYKRYDYAVSLLVKLVQKYQNKKCLTNNVPNYQKEK